MAADGQQAWINTGFLLFNKVTFCATDRRQNSRINVWHQIQLAGENLRQEHSSEGPAQGPQPGFQVL